MPHTFDLLVSAGSPDVTLAPRHPEQCVSPARTGTEGPDAVAEPAHRCSVPAVMNGSEGAQRHNRAMPSAIRSIGLRPVDAVREGPSTAAHGGTTAQPTRDEVLARPSETEETPV
ncbi:hypothetical protein ABT275_42240 [Streptomyces sp. NPDC001185]|uniref:hypothetical protein n=1 Tax=Streptomyces sp. NPDC001185 TaxID=3154380 RepID=UPI003327D0C9